MHTYTPTEGRGGGWKNKTKQVFFHWLDVAPLMKQSLPGSAITQIFQVTWGDLTFLFLFETLSLYEEKVDQHSVVNGDICT